MPAEVITVPVPDRLGAAVRALTVAFRDAGLDTPDLDARRLVAAAAGVTAERLVTAPDHLLDGDARRRIAQSLERRLKREPVSRILGRRNFYGREFLLSPSTLDPRPETETVVEEALSLIREAGLQDQPISILDVGTGTGAILLTLLAELPRACGLGTDVDSGALEIASRNAERLVVAGRSRFQLARSLFGVTGPFDLMVSNPPYIASSQIETLAAEVRLSDPIVALDGGADGLDIYRELLADAARVVPSGRILLEVGAGQSQAVIDIARLCIQGIQPDEVRVRDDLAGLPRCVSFLLHG